LDVNVTVPVGEPLPWVAVTTAVSVTALPITEGLGAPVRVVTVSLFFAAEETGSTEDVIPPIRMNATSALPIVFTISLQWRAQIIRTSV
jgi:hypothetical protein